MVRMARAWMVAAVALAAGGVLAQPASGRGPGPGAGPAASAPASAAGMGMGLGPGHRGGRWGADHTPGWSLMSEQERNEHRERMRSMTSYDECKALRDEHHAQMAERAKARGAKPLPQPRRDACAGLKR